MRTLAVIATLLVCGCAAPAPQAPDRLAPRLAECWALMDAVGWQTWAGYGRELQAHRRIRERDLSAQGLRGGTDLSTGLIYLDDDAVERMPARHLCLVLLNEMCHTYYQTASEAEFDRLHPLWVADYEARFGPFDGGI